MSKKGGYNQRLRSRLVLADLAGSERVRKTTPTGVRLEEAKYINSSLSALGNVISALASNSAKANQQFIPYRTSKLTRVLTNCLGFDSKIVVLATLTPAKSSYFESVSTLQFATRCQDIALKPVQNDVVDQTPPEVVVQKLIAQMAEREEKHQNQM